MTIINDKKLKVYAIFSDSHESMYKNCFLPSLVVSGLDLVVKKIPQIGSGSCGADGFAEVMLKKVEIIIGIIKDNWGSNFIISDVDIIFLKDVSSDLLRRLRGKDILFQSDSYYLKIANTGFFICSANDGSLRLWQECKERLKETISLGLKFTEQYTVNQIIKENSKIAKIGLLPLGKYYCSRQFFDLNNFIASTPKFPQGIYIYHANYLSDLEKKEVLLNFVTDQIRQKEGISMTWFNIVAFKKYYVWFFGSRIKRFIKRLI